MLGFEQKAIRKDPGKLELDFIGLFFVRPRSNLSECLQNKAISWTKYKTKSKTSDINTHVDTWTSEIKTSHGLILLTLSGFMLSVTTDHIATIHFILSQACRVSEN